MSVNRVFLMGNLGADPEVRYSQNQNAVGNLNIATNERRQGPDGQWTDHTEWHRVICFGKTAENCKQYLQKGRPVFIEGKLQTRKYQDQEGKDRYITEIIANSVQFLNAGGDRSQSRSPNIEVDRMAADSSAAPSSKPTSSAKASLGESISFDDDDIPF